MKLYLARHGQATKVGGVSEASLTDAGVDGVRRVAGFLAGVGDVAPAVVRHSTKLRARQTAEILAGAFGAIGRVEEAPGLAPDDPVADVAAAILYERDDLMLVGHLPFMNRLASLLICGNEAAEAVDFPPGGVLCLLRNAPANRDPAYHLSWMIRPDLLE